MASKRSASSISNLMQKKARSDQDDILNSAPKKTQNPFMSRPVNPQQAVYFFLVQSRQRARNLMKEQKGGSEKPVIEIEARLGMIKAPYGLRDMRILPSGSKSVMINGKQSVVNAFMINDSLGSPSQSSHSTPKFQGGITRTHFTRWTATGLTDKSPLSRSFDIKGGYDEIKSKIKSGQLKEVEYTETVYGGYRSDPDQRLCFPGNHPSSGKPGKRERKKKEHLFDVALPAASYDLRLTLATETPMENNLTTVQTGYTSKRLKIRRSYTFKSFAWQLDVTEVSTALDTQSQSSNGGSEDEGGTLYEIELELLPKFTLDLVNSADGEESNKMCKWLSQQLWFMLSQLNPMSDVLDVDSYIEKSPDTQAVKLALSQCASLKTFMETKQQVWNPAIHPQKDNIQPTSHSRLNFIGCMPVNFSRHDIEKVQRNQEGYYLSEKTDGVRYLMVFTGKTVVLIDRAMEGSRPISKTTQNPTQDVFSHVIPLIQKGTVLDGEVVINRQKRRPIFIVFDVLCSGGTPVLHLPFKDRLDCLLNSRFRTDKAKDKEIMFSPALIDNPSIALPLFRKQFFQRKEMDRFFLKHVVEEKGERNYVNGKTHHHGTDGVIFQPNLPYKIGTDVHLLKWKYLDTVTIDVEILEADMGNMRHNDDPNKLRFGVLGDEGTRVDMTRHIHLPSSEVLRLEADRFETKAKIAEVGFDPDTGEWYYLTMRPDKTGPNHISTVLGTLIELGEGLGTTELRCRMSIGAKRDTYRTDMNRMMKQLLDHMRRSNSFS